MGERVLMAIFVVLLAVASAIAIAALGLCLINAACTASDKRTCRALGRTVLVTDHDDGEWRCVPAPPEHAP